MKAILKYWLYIIFITVSICACAPSDDNSNGIVDGINVHRGKKIKELSVHSPTYYYHFSPSGESKEIGYIDILFKIEYDDKDRLSKIFMSEPKRGSSDGEMLDFSEILKVDYNFNTITTATHTWYFNWRDGMDPYDDPDFKRGDQVPPYVIFKFTTNNKGYISTLSDYTFEYDANGFLANIRETNKLWSLSYAKGDLNEILLEDITALNSSQIFNFYYTNGSNAGEMYIYIDAIPNNKTTYDFNYYRKNFQIYHKVPLLIAYQCGLFGNTTTQYRYIANNGDKTIHLEPNNTTDTNTDAIQFIKLSFVYE